MAQGAQSAKFSRAAHEKQSIRAETTSDGRYIPHSGGLMGWFENSGVLKNELPNNYRFYTIIDAASVRQKLFMRWGGGEKISRRAVERQDTTREVDVTLAWGDKTAAATTRDYSTHGLRLQLKAEEDPALNKGDEVRVQIMDKPAGGEMLFDIPANLMWLSSAGRNRSIWSIGLAFGEIPRDEREKLRDFFRNA